MINKRLFKGKQNFHFVLFLLMSLFVNTIAIAQKDLTISGSVKDLNNLPIPGANVLEKGTKNVVTTDFDGKFSIRVASQASVLLFSYIGYETMSKAVGSTKVFDITLKESASTLNEVVVIGYGTAKKSDLTGSVVSISGKDLQKQPIANVAETLTGRLAGVQVTSSEGSPDADIKIRIRGGGSLTQDSSPLIIIDGFPGNSLNDISPSDIENVTVLKDASSTAIYGSRGANGVIIVTTKQGKNGKIAVSYNAFYGAKRIAKTIDVLDPEDYVRFQYEYALLSSSGVSSYEKYFGQWQDFDQYAGIKGNNWQKQIYGRLGEVQSHDLGIKGGSEKISFNFNYARYDEKAIMIGSTFKRNNFSLSLNAKPNDKVSMSFTMRYSDAITEGGGANEQKEKSSADARLRHSVGYSPIPLPGLTTDDTDEAVAGYLVNPFVAVDDNNRSQGRNNLNMLGSIAWKPIAGLQLKTDLGLNELNTSDYRFYGRSTFYVTNAPLAIYQGMPALIFNEAKGTAFRMANTVNYDFKKLLGTQHQLTALIGQEILNTQAKQTTTTVQGFPKFFSFENAKNLTSQGVPLSVDNDYSPDDKLLSFFGRLNYTYNDKYLFTATYRADGSSKFLGNNRWGYFPSAAIAWKISQEDFLKDISWLNSLKVRLSYGQAGNNNIPTGQTVQTFQSSISTAINNVSSIWAASKILANPDLKWETTTTQNLGLDYELFKGRITGAFEVYHNVTSDLLLNFPTPGTGYDSQFRNIGETQNKGLEASLNVVAIDKEKYGLNISMNIGVNKNRINSLGEMKDFGVYTGWASNAITSDFIVKTGMPLGLMYGYKSDGRYEVADFNYVGGAYTLKAGVANNATIVGNPVPGMMKLKDIDGDGLVNQNDLTIIGDANPKHTGGFVLNANAYGFDLSAAFNWSYGNSIYNANKIEFTTANQNGQYRNLSSEMADGNRWTNIDRAGNLVTDPAALEALNANTTMWSPVMRNFVMSDWAIEDGSFLRLNTLSLGYSPAKSFVSRFGVSNMRFYATATNVFIITNYSGLDPEVSTRRSTPLTPGVDYSPFPRSRQIVFGVNLNF